MRKAVNSMPTYRRLKLESRVPPPPASHSSGKLPHSVRCGDYPRRLRTRAAHGVSAAGGGGAYSPRFRVCLQDSMLATGVSLVRNPTVF